ncbi:MAG: fluoride efflux transporter CrcB [Acidimicrobiales bacterium]|nr:fluoride efflux transporter CrcB [Hyphomonadaceae bacterium]RZV42005.1 MAG: fluoride efflux transporter CrcB [Acidimicrobiales bacterium]
MNGLLTVALGGAIGASARYLLGGVSLRVMGAGFPWGTFVANVLGGLLMGLLVGWLAHKGSQLEGGAQNLRLFLGVGVLGGFTTFSAFSLDTMLMIEKKAYGLAAGYISASVVLSILALFLGLVIARKVFVL